MKKFKKTTILTASLMAVFLAVAGGTLAYLTVSTDNVVNTFNPSVVEIKVDEPEWKDGKTVKENVTIGNTGDTEAYIRASIVVNWVNEQNDILGTPPVEGTDYSMSLGESWEDVAGYYYWPHSVLPDDPLTEEIDYKTTGVLIKKCEVLKSAPVEGYVLRVDVLAQAVQSEPDSAIKDLWRVTINEGKVTQVTTTP